MSSPYNTHRYSDSEKYVLYDLFFRFRLNQINSLEPKFSNFIEAIKNIMISLFSNEYQDNQIFNLYYKWKKKGFPSSVSLLQKIPSIAQYLSQEIIQSDHLNESDFSGPCVIASQASLNTIDNEAYTSILNQNTQLQAYITYLEHSNSDLAESQRKLQIKNDELNEEIMNHLVSTLIQENLNSNYQTNFFFIYHLSHFMTNQLHSKGNNWNSDLFDNYIEKQFNMNSEDFSNIFYGLISFLPEYWFNIFRQFFILPSLNTCKDKRKQVIETLKISPEAISQAQYNKDILQTYIEYFWGPINSLIDPRFLLVIDAAALSINFGVNKQTHETIGLITPHKEYNGFEDSTPTKTEIARDVFVTMLCPLDPNLKPIIINREYTSSGAAHQSELKLLKTIEDKLTNIGLEFIGTASDGDPQYYKYSKKFATVVLNNLEDSLKISLHELIQAFQQVRWFQDVLHLLKCDRYTIVKGKKIRILSSCPDIFITDSNLRNSLSKMSTLVFKDTQATKMLDSLVFQLFNWDYIQEAMINNPLLIPILLPPALLLQIFYNKDLDRKDRYFYINIGAALILIHLISLDYKGKGKLPEGECHPINKQAIRKYLCLAASLASLFLDTRAFDLADCTSHLLEHFFGLIRRFAGGDNHKEKFEQCLTKAIFLQVSTHQLNVTNKIPGRKGQDSGAVVEEGELDTEIKNIPFGEFVYAAYNLLSEIFKNHTDLSHQNGYNIDDYLPESIKFIKNFQNDRIIINVSDMHFTSISSSPNTAKQASEIASGGLINMRQHVEDSQANEKDFSQ